MSLSCDGLEERLRACDETTARSFEPSSLSTLTVDGPAEATPTLKLPHMLVSIALDEDQLLPNPEACRRWICAFPGLAKYVRVEGIFASYSTVLILSIPVVVWNMLPDNPACQPITYVTSTNLIREQSVTDSNYKLDFVESTSPSLSSASSATDATLCNISDCRKGGIEFEDLVNFQDFNHTTSLPLRYSAEPLSFKAPQSYCPDFEPLDGHHGAANPTSVLMTTSVKTASTDVLSSERPKFPDRALLLPLNRMEAQNSTRKRYPPACETLESTEHDTSWHEQNIETMPAQSFDRSKIPYDPVKEYGHGILAEDSKNVHSSSSSDFLPRFRVSRGTSTGRNESFDKIKLFLSIFKGLYYPHSLSPRQC
jgi:hypothetical protein